MALESHDLGVMGKKGPAMILIAHRGNINGRDLLAENHQWYIEKALEAGYDCEIDVWKTEDGLFLGHDEPVVKTNIDFLLNENLWVHAKNIEALHDLVEAGAHCFFHDRDDATLTSRGFLWTYPGRKLTSMSICVMPEWGRFDSVAAGVCSDFVLRYK